MQKVSLAALIAATCFVAASAVPAAARDHEDRGEHRGWARPYPVYVAPYPVDFLRSEVSLSVNTAAAGGNASLMTIG